MECFKIGKGVCGCYVMTFLVFGKDSMKGGIVCTFPDIQLLLAQYFSDCFPCRCIKVVQKTVFMLQVDRMRDVVQFKICFPVQVGILGMLTVVV